MSKKIKLIVNREKKLTANNISDNTTADIMDVTVEIHDGESSDPKRIQLHEINHSTTHLFERLPDNCTVEFYVEGRYDTCYLGSPFSYHLVRFFKHYKPETDAEYDSDEFAVEMNTGKYYPKPHLFNIDTKELDEENMHGGNLVLLMNKEGAIEHFAVYLGCGYYLQLYGATSPLLVATLPEMHKFYPSSVQHCQLDFFLLKNDYELESAQNNPIKPDNSQAIPNMRCFLPGKVTEIEITPWYRGDRREPTRIFEEGFTSRGTNTNVIEHVHGNSTGPIKDSAYISTSTAEDAALRYPKEHMGRSYLYLINPQKSAVDVNKVLVLEVDSGRLTQDTVEFYLADKEMAVPNKIESKHIKGAFVAESTALTKEPHELSDLYEREVKPESFIRNPDYIEPYAKTIKTLKLASKGVMAVGIYLDTKSLFEMYQRSEVSGNYHLFFKEAARVAGGWTGAIALGNAWGVQGAGYVSRFTKHPGAILAGGVVSALVGSVVGYTGGGVIAGETYDRGCNPYTPSIWTELYDTLKRLEPDHTGSEVTLPRAIKQHHELDDVFEKLNNFWEGFKQEIREEGSISGAIIKHLPSSSQEKLSLMEALRRMDYNYLPESASARRTAEEMFGEIQTNSLTKKNPNAKLLRSANLKSGGHPSHMFKDATIEPVGTTEDEASKQHAVALFKHAKVSRAAPAMTFLHKKSIYPSQSSTLTPERHAELEKYHQKIYESTDRARAIRESLKSGEQPLREMSLNQYCQMTSSCLGDAALIASRLKRPEAKLLADLGTGIERIGAGNMMLQMAALSPEAAWMTPCGYFAIAAGVTVLLTMAFQSDDDAENDAMLALMQGIHQLGQMLQQVLENQVRIHDTLQVTLNTVLAVEARVKQHQAETRASLGFISTLELQNACLALLGDLTKSNTVSLTKDARRQALSTLENWLKQHLFSPAINMSASATTSSTLACATKAHYH